ncbi:amino acid ABC transporter permease [Propionicicella superfundia]|uniref:amino acid ABC transporter permease n=1 Tax=Propionicicella superfundia TaxID=348582 RepID=UPI00041DE826|nr:amino acid ABC transporter permease [Propionicicella superfundia]
MSAAQTRVLFDEPGPRGRVTIVVSSIAVSLLVVAGLVAAVLQFRAHGQLATDRWQLFLDPAIIRFLAEGIGRTFLATGVAAVFSYPLGLVLALGRLSRNGVVSRVAGGWVEFFRSIPMLLVVYAFLLALPRLGQGFVLPVFWMLVVPMILVSSASTAEVFRAGIRAVEPGQWEAAESLGMEHSTLMRLVVLPQAFRIVLPSLLTGLVSLLKDSTLGYVVSYPELMQQGKTLTAYYSYLIQTYLIVAVIYVLLNLALTKLAESLQARGNRKTAARPAGGQLAAAIEATPAQ